MESLCKDKLIDAGYVEIGGKCVSYCHFFFNILVSWNCQKYKLDRKTLYDGISKSQNHGSFNQNKYQVTDHYLCTKCILGVKNSISGESAMME